MSASMTAFDKLSGYAVVLLKKPAFAAVVSCAARFSSPGGLAS
jgi:hypothetical protein